MNSLYDFEEVFHTPYFSIEASKKNYSEDTPYYRILTNDSVICLILNSNDEIILVRQMRPNLGYETFEFPAGTIEIDEVADQAAKREVEEETGFLCKFIFLGNCRLLMNRLNNVEHLYIGLVESIGNKKDTNTFVKKISRKSFLDSIKNNQFEQLAALGIIKLVNVNFGIDFLNEETVLDKIWRNNES
jgi:ADP-ribose pyrophosphatase